ncbi:RagB/SusD family nutrient uptake outer membrane protein [Mucilaginibacter daejeonensis]|uniref:RagB/SusD family nutrient uptake outer membrane protein n=1 Tax=Mucilaginibacter daejeonensis TaxID=398049 RepID=UPI001D17952A|nr:RagB/SusD family nutrient uptake outer membrane protein [Mucilaginibacter daejeonensis]UEG54154.1 RagB/SusD family nutrient uptake outer membrane protein [Mucilaginibacter daejeonensis]
MKNILYKIAGIGFVTVAMMSCTKRLNEVNPGGATSDATWTTPQGFVTAVNGAYQEQRAYYGKEDGPLISEGGTDLWFTANKISYANQVTKYSGLTPASPSSAGTIFRLFYRAINQCNAGINRIDQAGFTDQAEKNRRLGELRFLRAFYYWHIVEQFGGVNLRTTETQTAELTATRSSVSAFYDLILSDLKFAADNLPVSYSGGANGEYSRASKKSAMGMLARAYLSRAYYATGQERTDYMTLARNTANDVIARKTELGTDLWASPAELWNPSNNKNNKEALYIISNSTNVTLDYDGNANRLHAWYLTTYNGRPGLVRSFQYGFDGQKRLQPTRYLLNLFNEQIDGRYAASFQETWNANASSAFTWNASSATTYGKATSVIGQQITPGSRAMEITKQVVPDKATKPWVLYDINDLYNANGTIRSLTDFVPLIKFIDLTRTDVNAQPGFNDIMVIRLAEMYLIAAEAEFQLGNFGAAATQLNVLRTRAAIKVPVDRTAAMQTTAAEVQAGGINFILDERARELCGEHLRWYDLKRTLNGDQFAARIKAANPDITDVQPYHRLRPVPQVEINALTNGAEFGQNPGY